MRRYSPDGLQAGDFGCGTAMLGACIVVAFWLLVAMLCGFPHEAVDAAGEWRTAKCTAYCNRCSSGTTATGKRLQPWFVAADPRYHRFGEVVEVIVGGRHLRYRVEDTGGAIKGRDRFDLCQGMVQRCPCNRFGVQRLRYRVVSRP